MMRAALGTHVHQWIGAGLAAASLAFPCHGHAGGNPGLGKTVFLEECAECHSVRPGTNKKGPSLFGIGGRKAAGISDFVYSDAMKQSGITWTPERLSAYVGAPKKIVAGGKMKYDGLDDVATRENLIAYLLSLHD